MQTQSTVFLWLRWSAWGGFVWLVPFAISVPFFDASGTLLIEMASFAMLMGLCLTTACCIALVRVLRAWISAGNAVTHRTGWLLGFLWLTINGLLDMVVLLPLSGMSFFEYMLQIGPGYLSIPVMTLTASALVAYDRAHRYHGARAAR